MDDTKACPVCGETIKAVALKCRFCNTDLQAAEKELFSGNPALIYSVGQLVPFLALVAVTGVLAYEVEAGLELYVALGFLVVCGLICLSFYVKSKGTHYIISTQRIKLERGILSKVQESLELFRVDHFELRRPLGMRLLGQASLHLFSSDAELGNFSIYAIPNLEALSDTLRDCQLRERTRRGLATFVKA